ncbi:MAG: hypothetical protein AB7F35_13085 [Acetobacteraceae bacterium]
MRIILLLLLLAVVAMGYPLIQEDTTSECDALERIAVRVLADGRDTVGRPADTPMGQMLGQILQGASKGQFAGIAVRNEFPELPASVACALLYWKARLDPEGFRKDPIKLLP